MLHPQVAKRLEEIERVVIETQESGKRIIDKTGPLDNPADRDHCIQYMVAVPLIFGRLTAEDYEDAVACDPRIDLLRDKMQVIERKQFTVDYLDPAKRSIGNSVQVFFKDGTQTERVAVEYPIGHRRRRKEGVPAVAGQIRTELARTHPGAQGRRDPGALLRSREPGDHCRESLHGSVRRLMLRRSKGRNYRPL